MRFLRARPAGGFALVLTLLLIFLMAVLVVAVFSTVGTETKASNAGSNGQVSRQMADLAVQVVKSQLQTATTQGPAVAWASQPGMVRCYDNTGTETKWYKLYSAASMVQNSPGGAAAGLLKMDLPDQNYVLPGSVDYGVFTDLNSPVTSADGSTLVYPIADPRDALSISPGTNVAGFDIDLNNLPPGYQSASAASSTNNPAAMPVRWMYVLKDGTLVAAAATGIPGQVKVAAATTSNPVAGRVAFWTDDETCKLNVNTAGDGSYFDTPRFNSAAPSSPPTSDAVRIRDQQFAVTPPYVGEYQRYIGHPAQTRLSYVLPKILAADIFTRTETFSSITPFLQWIGTQGGNRTIYQMADMQADAANPKYNPARQTPYASVDEWMFGSGAMDTNNQRPLNKFPDGTNLATNDSLGRVHFFLTATSEAPEVNLYGKPRISIWPIHNDYYNSTPSQPSKYTTALDRMIAHASTLKQTTTVAGGDHYFFTRADSVSQTNDFSQIPRNQSLYAYLQSFAGTAVPGYGGSFSTKYNSDGTNQILTEIFDYIRSTNINDPALMAPGWSSLADVTSTQTDYSYGKYRTDKWGWDGHETLYAHPGFGQVTPITFNPPGGGAVTRGFGRFYTINEIAIDFTKVPQIPATATQPARPPLLDHQIIVVGNLYLGLYSPSLGAGDMESTIRVVVDTGNLGAFKVSDGITTQANGSKQFPVFSLTHGWTAYSAIPHALRWYGGNDHAFLWGGATGPRELFADKGPTYLADGTVNTNPNTYSLNGIPMILDDRGQLTLNSGSSMPLTIKIYSSNTNAYSSTGDGSPGQPGEQLIQTITVSFPGFTNLPMPSNGFVNRYGETYNLVDRIQNGSYTPGNFYARDDAAHAVSGNDTIRSMVVGYNGDARLAALQANVANGFVKHPQFDSSSLRCVHSLRDNSPYLDPPPYPTPVSPTYNLANHRFVSNGFIPATNPPTSLVNSGGYGLDAQPVIGLIDPANYPASSYPPPDTSGDWDNGTSIFPDGPYINKPDEVNSQYFAGPNNNVDTTYLPYYHTTDIINDLTMAKSYASPNRTVASPVMFGSLPTGVVSNTPWQTLLFRPQQNHFGQSSPKDSLLLDWFWMPVVEPYAISTPMATSGKVNMNYQLAPFTYIKRATALMGVLGSEYVISVPTSDGGRYKALGTPGIYRYPVKVLENDNSTIADTDGTLRQFKAKFDSGQIFKSASDICDIYLVPTGQSWLSDKDAENFWSNNKLTGDNSRERPYNGLYPRLTTKSNTFTVHVRAQALRAPPSSDPTVWMENPLVVQSEYRGSVTINRYLDPEDASIPDFANLSSLNGLLANDTLDKHYKYRVLETRRFLP